MLLNTFSILPKSAIEAQAAGYRLSALSVLLLQQLSDCQTKHISVIAHMLSAYLFSYIFGPGDAETFEHRSLKHKGNPTCEFEHATCIALKICNSTAKVSCRDSKMATCFEVPP